MTWWRREICGYDSSTVWRTDARVNLLSYWFPRFNQSFIDEKIRTNDFFFLPDFLRSSSGFESTYIGTLKKCRGRDGKKRTHQCMVWYYNHFMNTGIVPITSLGRARGTYIFQWSRVGIDIHNWLFEAGWWRWMLAKEKRTIATISLPLILGTVVIPLLHHFYSLLLTFLKVCPSSFEILTKQWTLWITRVHHGDDDATTCSWKYTIALAAFYALAMWQGCGRKHHGAGRTRSCSNPF